MIGPIVITGDKEIMAALRRVSGDIADEASKAVQATGLEIQGDIKKRYARGAKTGRIYQLYNPRRTHQASAPGQAPAVDLDGLMKSVTMKMVGPLTADVFTLVDYGFYLEYGTRRIAPRPAWKPAALAAHSILKRRLAAALGRATR